MYQQPHMATFRAAIFFGLVTLLLAGQAVSAMPGAVTPSAAVGSNSSTIVAELGKALFSDKNLSNPAGMSCATCHAQSAGFTYPISTVNQHMGPVPGVVPGRFGNRRPPTIAYAVFLPPGPPTYTPSLTAFSGGLFWDGRANNLANQATFPFQNANEENDLVHNLGSPALVVSKLAADPNASMFKQVYGKDIFAQPTATVFADITQAIAAYEATPEVSPFTSKYDAYLLGKATLTFHEMNGLMLFTGSTTGRPGGPPHKFAQCTLCHGIAANPAAGPDIFTNSCYANIGVPKNPNNPYYKMTSKSADPAGYNPAGAAYIDLGLGGSLYAKIGLSSGNIGPGSNGQGDYLAINGTFKAPTLRNVDKRPSSGFVKCYGHNGYFKSLAQVVHFYNTRNLTDLNEVIDFTQPSPYDHLKGHPLWPPPEYPSVVTLQNPNGAPASASAQVGNLQLTHEEENEIVLFLQTLSDGYFTR
jgi:cytochrome c peroxidase